VQWLNIETFSIIIFGLKGKINSNISFHFNEARGTMILKSLGESVNLPKKYFRAGRTMKE